MAFTGLISDTAKYVKFLLTEKLPDGMDFHTLQHTQAVVNVTKDMAKANKLEPRDAAIVQIAAWFHDSGYCSTYIGHENSSIAIARTFLEPQHLDADFTNEVVDCIRVTKVHQVPQNLNEQILRDAEMFHLSLDDYLEYAQRLRSEWEKQLNRHYTQKTWVETNINFLTKHTYYTQYAREIFQNGKLKNVDRLLAIF